MLDNVGMETEMNNGTVVTEEQVGVKKEEQFACEVMVGMVGDSRLVGDDRHGSRNFAQQLVDSFGDGKYGVTVIVVHSQSLPPPKPRTVSSTDKRRHEFNKWHRQIDPSRRRPRIRRTYQEVQ